MADGQFFCDGADEQPYVAGGGSSDTAEEPPPLDAVFINLQSGEPAVGQRQEVWRIAGCHETFLSERS